MRDEHIISLIENAPLASLSKSDLAAIGAHTAQCSDCLRAFKAAQIAALLLKQRAAEEFDIDLQQSWMVGDRYSDVELARNAGVRSMFVLSGYGRGEWEHQRASWTSQPDLVAEDLLEAVGLIVQGAEPSAV